MGLFLMREILASVYLAMTGGQASLFDDEANTHAHAGNQSALDSMSGKGELRSNSPILFASTEELARA